MKLEPLAPAVRIEPIPAVEDLFVDYDSSSRRLDLSGIPQLLGYAGSHEKIAVFSEETRSQITRLLSFSNLKGYHGMFRLQLVNLMHK